MATRKKSRTGPAVSSSTGPVFAAPMLFSADDPGRGRLEIKNAPRPSRSFCADSFCVELINSQVRLAFLQRQINGKAVRSMVEIRMNFEPFKNLHSSFVDFPKFSENNSDKFGYAVHEFEEPEQTLAYEATLARVVATGQTSVMDFYYIGAEQYANARELSVVNVEEVVSIRFPYIMLPGFFNVIKDFCSRIPLPEQEDGK